MKRQDSYVRLLKPADGQVDLAGAEMPPTSSDRRALWRALAIAADRMATSETSLAQLWRELVQGSCRVVDDFFTEDRCFVVIRDADAPAVPLEGRRLAILEAVLCGAGQKNVAIDLDLAPSTIALNARLGLEYLGLGCKPSRVHPLLMLAAQAESRGERNIAGSLSRVAAVGDALRIVALPRPDRRLFKVLPPGELAVIRLLVEGYCYREIAQRRGTSTRTIANQITAVFRRMRVSGRNELLTRLFFSDGVERAPLPRLAPPPVVARTEASSPAHFEPLRVAR